MALETHLWSTGMNSKIYLALFFAAFLVSSCDSLNTALKAKSTHPSFPCYFEKFEEFFPLAHGACWVYKGKLRTQVQGPTDERAGGAIVEEEKINDTTVFLATREIMPKVEIIDSVTRGAVTGYSVQGDFGWVTSRVQTFIILQPDKLFRTWKNEALDQMRNTESILYNLVGTQDDGPSEIFFDLPLIPGKKYGSQVQIFRLDNFYCWEVERVDWVSVDSIEGCPLRGIQPEFVLSYKTNPANVEFRIVPGLGVTGYKYVHHGTIEEVETRLIHYYPGISEPDAKPSQRQN